MTDEGRTWRRQSRRTELPGRALDSSVEAKRPMEPLGGATRVGGTNLGPNNGQLAGRWLIRRPGWRSERGQPVAMHLSNGLRQRRWPSPPDAVAGELCGVMVERDDDIGRPSRLPPTPTGLAIGWAGLFLLLLLAFDRTPKGGELWPSLAAKIQRQTRPLGRKEQLPQTLLDGARGHRSKASIGSQLVLRLWAGQRGVGTRVATSVAIFHSIRFDFARQQRRAQNVAPERHVEPWAKRRGIVENGATLHGYCLLSKH